MDLAQRSDILAHSFFQIDSHRFLFVDLLEEKVDSTEVRNCDVLIHGTEVALQAPGICPETSYF
jgi:hypothetical protein